MAAPTKDEVLRNVVYTGATGRVSARKRRSSEGGVFVQINIDESQQLTVGGDVNAVLTELQAVLTDLIAEVAEPPPVPTR